jgi:hypothetical protein
MKKAHLEDLLLVLALAGGLLLPLSLALLARGTFHLCGDLLALACIVKVHMHSYE